jgi:uroporphyrinogen decarboxylase
MKRTLNSKERVLTAFAHAEPDRVPIDYSANPAIDLRLKQHFGLLSTDDEGLFQALGVDFRYGWPNYVGPSLHPDLPDREIDMWGIHRRWVEHDTGGYWDYCDFPLSNATLETVESWPLPSPDDFDYTAFRSFCQHSALYCVVAGHAGVGDIINSTGMLRTMEQVLVDLITADPAGIRLIDRKTEVMVEVTARTLEAAHDFIDIVYMGEDLGTQIGPMLSKKLFRQHIRPRLQQVVDLARAYHKPVMFHSCGSSSWAFPDFIEMGIEIIDTLQPEAANMAPAYLKQTFGDRLAFHGCISTGGPVAYGTVEETVQSVRDTLEIMLPGGGYALSPSHMLQDNSPTENVLAMYAAAHEFGKYS